MLGIETQSVYLQILSYTQELCDTLSLEISNNIMRL